MGREVTRLLDRQMTAGHLTVGWEGHDFAGRQLPSGIYIARLLATPGARVTSRCARSIKLPLSRRMPVPPEAVAGVLLK